MYKQLFSPNIILKIIEELNIKDKIIWNDNYIEFVLYGRGKNGISFYENDEYYQFINNNPIEEINQYMRKENITKIEWNVVKPQLIDGLKVNIIFQG